MPGSPTATGSPVADAMPYEFTLSLPMPTADAVVVVTQALAVDAPIPGATRELSTAPGAQPALHIKCRGASTRALRVAVHAALDQVDLCLATMNAFGDAVA